jgi:sulfoxide reductase catalytic subunit YedY
VAKPGTYDFDDLVKPHVLEERVYRLRYFEAWLMLIPWVGFPLSDVIKRPEPTSKAK